MNQPNINVTPLIDVLLVLLIIFMVITPLKPAGFKTRVPSESEINPQTKPHPDTLAVIIAADSSLQLNAETELGTTVEPEKLTARLKDIFDKRTIDGNVSGSFADDPGRGSHDRIERTVFIKAPRTLAYGSVVRVVDAVKLGGAYPISLQIDDLE